MQIAVSTFAHFVAFSNQSSGKVYSHMEKVHGVKTFVCDFCKFTTKNRISMYNHTTKYCRKLRMMEKTGKDKDTKTKKSLTPIYVPDRKGGAKKYKCTECTFLAGSSGAVYKHMSEVHQMAKFSCSYCKFSTGNKTSMYNHRTRYCRKLKEK